MLSKQYVRHDVNGIGDRRTASPYLKPWSARGDNIDRVQPPSIEMGRVKLTHSPRAPDQRIRTVSIFGRRCQAAMPGVANDGIRVCAGERHESWRRRSPSTQWRSIAADEIIGRPNNGRKDEIFSAVRTADGRRSCAGGSVGEKDKKGADGKTCQKARWVRSQTHDENMPRRDRKYFRLFVGAYV